MDGGSFHKLTAYLGEVKVPLLISLLVAATIFFTMPSSTPAADAAEVSSTTDTVIPLKDGKKENGKAQDTNTPASTTPASTSKLSGAELKAQKKAEKAARRQQVIQTKQVGLAAPSPPAVTKGDVRRESKQQEGEELNIVLHEKTGSTVAGVEPVPLRGNIDIPSGPKPEDKTVELFRHLYKARAATIAGVSKDVHPAILALGQQMRSYTICGSNARLVATLQAVKRVSPVPNSIPLHVTLLSASIAVRCMLHPSKTAVSNQHIGNRVLHDPTREHSYSASHIACS
jgi:translation initiation factor eIF-2B subunit delta